MAELNIAMSTMRHWISLLEGPQGGTLYHSTDIQSAATILYQDAIDARTDHPRLGWKIKGVSLTRSYRFAVDWRRFGAIFALDGDKLRIRHRLVPIDYYNDRRESEEFLVGTIQPLSRYLTGIFITPETAKYCREHDNELVDGHKDYEELLAHPLLKITKFPAPVPYYNPRKPDKDMFGIVADQSK